MTAKFDIQTDLTDEQLDAAIALTLVLGRRQELSPKRRAVFEHNHVQLCRERFHRIVTEQGVPA